MRIHLGDVYKGDDCRWWVSGYRVRGEATEVILESMEGYSSKRFVSPETLRGAYKLLEEGYGVPVWEAVQT